MSEPRKILVFGATGSQGRALIDALCAQNTYNTSTWSIIAITRDANSSSSRALTKLPDVKVVQAPKHCMDQPAQVFASLGAPKGSVYGVFSVQGYVNDKVMVKQDVGKAIADAAQAFGVKHLVYSSTDIGDDRTKIPSTYEVKIKVEDHIRSLPNIGYSFLRPVQFMDVYLPEVPFQFKMGRTIWLRYTFYTHPQRKHQLISAKDIGRAGAKAFMEGPKWCDGVVRLAGDGLTAEEIERTYKEVMGEPIGLAPWPLARFVRAVVPVIKEFATLS